MNPSVIEVSQILPSFLKELSGDFPNINRRFGEYLLRLLLAEDPKVSNHHRLNSWRTIEKSADLAHVSPIFKSFVTLDELVPYVLECCSQQYCCVDEGFVKYLLHMLVRDSCDGLKTSLRGCATFVGNLQIFLQGVMNRCASRTDPSVCNLRLRYKIKTIGTLDMDYMRRMRENEFNGLLNDLMTSILQYPENSTAQQLQDMLLKMQVFVVTNYKLGSPQNHALLKLTRQSFNSVLGKGDLQNYVLKKRYHRTDYLKRLCATVCGILIFNNYNTQIEMENGYLRNIFDDLTMGHTNTKAALNECLDHVSSLELRITQAIENSLAINIAEQTVLTLNPLAKLRKLNKYLILFSTYKRALEHIKTAFNSCEKHLEPTRSKFNCVVEKIRSITKCKSAVESELIFPHFVYLSDVWTSLVGYLSYFAKVNNVLEQLAELANETVEHQCKCLLDETEAAVKTNRIFAQYTMQELFMAPKTHKGIDVSKTPPLRNYCALTLVLTKGLLVPSQVEKTLPSQDTTLGLGNKVYSKWAENHSEALIHALNDIVLSNVDLILAMQLDDVILKQDYNYSAHPALRQKSIETQTQTEAREISFRQKSSISWNSWDYHRQTIHLANLRQRQTHAAQTGITFGKRNCQNEAFDTRHHFGCSRNLS